MADAETPKRPTWFWPVAAVVVVILGLGGFAAPTVLECSSSSAGFGACLNTKLAELGLAPDKSTGADGGATSVAVAQPAETVETPPAAVLGAPDFGVRVEPNGSIVIAGSGATGKQVQIFVNGELYGTADVDAGGDWVLVPDAPLPPGGYELTIVDPVTGLPLDKSFVVAINDDLTSEPLVVASTPGKASEILQGLAGSTAVALADVPAAETAASDAPAADAAPADAPAADEPVAEEPSAEEPAADAPVAVADAADAINDTALPAGSDELATTPPAVDVAEAAPAEDAAVSTAEDVVGDVDALQQRADALAAMVAPSIDAVEIDNGRNYFAGTGADGAIIRVYVDNVFVGDAEVKDGHWLLETDNILQNRSQRVRADQLIPGSAEVVARAEIDFIFEEPAVAAPETAVAEAEPTVPAPDFGIDTSEAPSVDVAPDMTVAEADVTPAPEVPATTEAPAVAETSAAETPAADASATATDAAAPADSGESVAVASSAGGEAVAVPTPDFSIDTGIPVTVVAETDVAEAAPETPAAEPAPAAEPEVSTSEPAASEPAAEPEAPVAVATAEEPAEADVPQLVAKPVGRPELGRFATGKAIIRSGDNLWTIARRVYGSGYKYTQIYGANREQIRNPNLIYPGQVFDLPNMETAAASE